MDHGLGFHSDLFIIDSPNFKTSRCDSLLKNHCCLHRPGEPLIRKHEPQSPSGILTHILYIITWKIATMKSYYLGVSMAVYIPCGATPLACKRSSGCAAGLTVWSDANFAGISQQYNVSWDTCSRCKPSSHAIYELYQLTNTNSPVSIAAQFPFAQPAGVSSIAANEGNWCTVYPYVRIAPLFFVLGSQGRLKQRGLTVKI